MAHHEHGARSTGPADGGHAEERACHVTVGTQFARSSHARWPNALTTIGRTGRVRVGRAVRSRSARGDGVGVRRAGPLPACLGFVRHRHVLRQQAAGPVQGLGPGTPPLPHAFWHAAACQRPTAAQRHPSESSIAGREGGRGLPHALACRCSRQRTCHLETRPKALAALHVAGC